MPRLTPSAIMLVVATGTAAFAQAPPDGGRVRVNGMQIYYEVAGEGEPMVVLHGSLMTVPGMGDIVARLAETHRVYAPELQGHGRSTDIDRAITYHNLAGDIATFMEALGIERADVLGYSLGAIVGLRLAIDYPEKVDQLVFVSGAYAYEGWQPAFRDSLSDWTPAMLGGTPLAAAYRDLAPDPAGFPALAEKLIALEQAPFDWSREVAALKVPVLIIAGDADASTLEHNVEMFGLLGGGVMGDMGKPLPASRLAILPGTSHTALIGQADLMMRFITPFLAGDTPGVLPAENPGENKGSDSKGD